MDRRLARQHQLGDVDARLVDLDAQPGPVAQAAPDHAIGVALGVERAEAPGRQGAEHHRDGAERSEEHTSELQSLMRISYAVFCLKNKKTTDNTIEKANH